MSSKWMTALLRTSCALSMIASATASAGEKTGRITSVHLAQQHVDKVFLKIDGAYSQEPTCSASVSSWDFVLDISQSTGKTIYAQLLAAQYTQTPLQVVGTGTCLLHTNYETLQYIVVES
jgi:hypothetical protein